MNPTTICEQTLTIFVFLVVKVRQKAKFLKKKKKDEVILEGFHRQHWEKKIRQFSIFSFQCVAINIEDWLKFYSRSDL